MAWRIEDSIVRGEIDNREKGKVIGKLWMYDDPVPVTLELKGNCWRDMAGCLLTFSNPKPLSSNLTGFAKEQLGNCGDLTCSRKAKMPIDSFEGIDVGADPKQLPHKWVNVLYLEWFSEFNGRVVIEAAHYEYRLSLPEWTQTKEEEAEQQKCNASTLDDFYEQGMAAAEIDIEFKKTEEESVTEDESEAIDRILRINELKHKADQLSDGKIIYYHSEDLPADLEEQYWENLVNFESAPSMLRSEILKYDGYVARSPRDIDESDIEQHLWELIYALASRKNYLEQTDHFSNRELYELLYYKVLNEEVQLLPESSGWCIHIVISEYGSLDGSQCGEDVFLKYYADDEWRHQWKHDFPEYPMPSKEVPAYDRDHLLPGREEPRNSEGTDGY